MDELHTAGRAATKGTAVASGTVGVSTGGAGALDRDGMKSDTGMRIPADDMTRVRAELTLARVKAAELLEQLQAQATASQANGFLRVDGRPDVYRQVTGASSLEQTIAQARRLLDQYDRVLSSVGPTVDGLAVDTIATGSDNAVRSDGVVLPRARRVGPATVARTG